MQHTLLTTLVEQKRLIEYLKSIPTAEQQRATEALTQCVYLGVLLVILPTYPSTQQREVAELLATGTAESLLAWKQRLDPDLQLAIQETIERIFLSLETTV